MNAGRELLSTSPEPASAPGSERSTAAAPARRPAADGLSREGLSAAVGNRALARCPGCGGRCGGTCGHGHSEPDEELLASGQNALRRAVLARRQGVSQRS
jgi:hypothetical protein